MLEETKELVHGDVKPKVGHKVPADMRVVESISTILRVEHGSLTGESEAVNKTNKPVFEDTDIRRNKSLLVKGTVENLLEKSTKVQLLDGTVVPLDGSSRNHIMQALHGISTSALKPLNDAPALKLADIGIAMGISGIENMSFKRECAAAFKQVFTIPFLSLEDKANFQGGNIVMNSKYD